MHHTPGTDETVIEFHRRPTAKQEASLRRYLRNFGTAWAELVDDRRIAVHYKNWGMGGDRYHPDRVIGWMKGEGFQGMGQKGFGQRVAHPAGDPRGRLKFHWNPVQLDEALEVADACSGPVEKTCQVSWHPHAGELMTCTWRDRRGRIVAGAAGPRREIENVRTARSIGKGTSLWTDRELLQGRCPA
jgi:hypothetical protein